ncbi:MAG: Bax inhibitor-1/YccA family protein [Clostridia bacterium]|nr:Bax inhibitor-1/YccA family protein [Clostridia bacterium]
MAYSDDPFGNNDFRTPDNYGDTGTINANPFTGINAVTDENGILTNVFKWMGIGLGISAIAALGSYQFLPEFMMVAYIPLAIIELIMVLVLSFGIQKMSAGACRVCFIAYSVINGLTLSSIFFVYEIGSIFVTFFIAAGMFAVAALYGKFTKKNLASMGTYLLMGLFGIIVASIVNIFIRNSMLDFLVTLVGIAIFVGLTAYDVNKIREYSSQYGLDSKEQASKVIIYGALSLYLDFINLFLKLLRLFGSRRK